MLLCALVSAVSADVWDPDAFSPLLPLPMRATNGSSTLLVPSSIKFTLHGAAASSPVLASAVERYRGLMFAWGRSTAQMPTDGALVVRRVELSVADGDDSASSLQLGMRESYSLEVPAMAESVVNLNASTVWGALRGLETLSQLVEWTDGRYLLRMAPWSIVDRPRFPHRGVMIDTARHFLPVDTLLRAIEALSYSKLNTLHWHATDTQSFPLELRAFPALSAKGAFAPSAVYSPEDVQTVVEHGRQHGVRVLLEIDTPGHSSSWALGHPELFLTCPAAWGEYGGTSRCAAACLRRLPPPPASGAWHAATRACPSWRRIMDPTNPAVYAFLDGLIGEIASRLPERVLHMGGDEVGLDCWNSSAAARAWVAARQNATFRDLYVHYEQKVHAIAKKHGLAVQTWADVFSAVEARGGKLPPDAIAQKWGSEPTVAELVRNGTRAVLSAGYVRSSVSKRASSPLTRPFRPRLPPRRHPQATPGPHRRLFPPDRAPRPEQYLSEGFSTGGGDLVWESIYNFDPMPEGLSAAEQSRLLGGEAAMWGEVTDGFNIDSKLWFRAGGPFAERCAPPTRPLPASCPVDDARVAAPLGALSHGCIALGTRSLRVSSPAATLSTSWCCPLCSRQPYTCAARRSYWSTNESIAAAVKPWPASYLSPSINVRMVYAAPRFKGFAVGMAPMPACALHPNAFPLSPGTAVGVTQEAPLPTAAAWHRRAALHDELCANAVAVGPVRALSPATQQSHSKSNASCARLRRREAEALHSPASA